MHNLYLLVRLRIYSDIVYWKLFAFLLVDIRYFGGLKRFDFVESQTNVWTRMWIHHYIIVLRDARFTSI